MTSTVDKTGQNTAAKLSEEDAIALIRACPSGGHITLTGYGAHKGDLLLGKLACNKIREKLKNDWPLDEALGAVFHYRLIELSGGFEKYGACEVCSQKASVVWMQVEQRVSFRESMTRYQCRPEIFGHEECLEKLRRGWNTNNNVVRIENT